MKPAPGKISRLTESRAGDAVQVLVDAFTGDPLLDYLFPEHRERPEQLNQFFRANLEYTLSAGEVYTAPSMAGVAAWLFPREVAMPVIHKANDPRLRLKSLLEDGAYRRLDAFTRSITDIHSELKQGRHCYLMFLGVSRAEQGKGIGSLLLKTVLEMADEKRLPCMLDTMNARNPAFYGRHNFAVCSEKRVCGDGPLTWTMLRQPQP